MATLKATSVKDVDSATFVRALAAHLKRSGKMVVPAYCDHIKTSTARELGPDNVDWFYIRAAAIARRLYVRRGMGVGAFRRVFGTSKRKNMLRSHHADACGGIIRYILKEFEKLELVAKSRDGGRMMTASGQRVLDRIANQLKTTRVL
jgi:small subunit ribosomal protein S19e